MDGHDDGVAPDPSTMPLTDRAQIDNAIRALSEKKPVPEIDFTLHTMEDGSQVSTMERVCKGMPSPSLACVRARRRSLRPR